MAGSTAAHRWAGMQTNDNLPSQLIMALPSFPHGPQKHWHSQASNTHNERRTGAVHREVVRIAQHADRSRLHTRPLRRVGLGTRRWRFAGAPARAGARLPGQWSCQWMPSHLQAVSPRLRLNTRQLPKQPSCQLESKHVHQLHGCSLPAARPAPPQRTAACPPAPHSCPPARWHE